MLHGLEELLELSLRRSDELEITLEEELEFLTTYLAIERIRFPDRLQVEIDVPAGLRSARVPFMLLQPLVENAIHHAVARSDRAGRIRISAVAAGPHLEVRVRDNGSPAQIQSSGGEGIGWSNIRDRLRELYGADQRFSVERSENAGLEVSIALPLRGATAADAVPAPAVALAV
jgi:two-component system, LytTR family, sensor kinase